MSARVETPRAGFSIVECLIAMMLISAILLMLAPSLFHFANERVSVDAALLRDSFLRGQFNRLASLSFDNLDAQAGCITVSDAELPHTRCVSVAVVSDQERVVTINITPTHAFIPPDTLVMTRTELETNPFDTGQP
jgi:prepilin-type N-terminal cleavage/methylation domain-containing protein